MHVAGLYRGRGGGTRLRDEAGQTIDPRRELLGLAAANIATAAVGGYPVAGGLSQTAVNEGAGARSRMSLVFASLTLALCLMFFTALLADLPKAVLAAVVLMAVVRADRCRAIAHMWRASRMDFLNALGRARRAFCCSASCRAYCWPP